MADGELDGRLDTVKRGYDPQQVKRLVATLSAELKSLDAENAALRQQLDVARLGTAVGASRATDDIISSWTRETGEMLEGARQHVSRIMEKANEDADAVREGAQADAERLLADARDMAATEARTSRTQAQAGLDQLTAETQRLRSEIEELEHERGVIREQFIDTQVYLQGLVAMIEPAPTVGRERS
jgi:cell division septum initiation protein DivIVA